MGWLWAWKAIPFKLLGINTKLPFPADSTVRIHNAKNLIFDKMTYTYFSLLELILIIFLLKLF